MPKVPRFTAIVVRVAVAVSELCPDREAELTAVLCPTTTNEDSLDRVQ